MEMGCYSKRLRTKFVGQFTSGVSEASKNARGLERRNHGAGLVKNSVRASRTDENIAGNGIDRDRRIAAEPLKRTSLNDTVPISALSRSVVRRATLSQLRYLSRSVRAVIGNSTVSAVLPR